MELKKLGRKFETSLGVFNKMIQDFALIVISASEGIDEEEAKIREAFAKKQEYETILVRATNVQNGIERLLGLTDQGIYEDEDENEGNTGTPGTEEAK